MSTSAASPAPPLYTASVPRCVDALQRLHAWLALAESHAAGGGFALDGLMDTRPAAGMLPFGVQGQILVNLTLRTAFPLAGLPRPEYGDDPDTPDGLRARIARAQALLQALAPEAFADAAGRLVVERAGDADITLPGERFLYEFALPNLYFHLTAAYIALRGAGVPLGKADFDGLHVYPAPAGR